MRLGRVTGKLWSTARIPQHAGKRYLIVQPVDARGADRGPTLVCLDAIGAGPGDVIYWARGKEASLAFYPELVSSDATVVGIVDEIANEAT
jgi:microcompartment protein CcmK/EutM